MNLTRTVKIKLETEPKVFKETFSEYEKAFNSVCNRGWTDRDKNIVSLQHKMYQELRKTLPAQLCISVLHKSSESLKSSLNLSNKKSSCPVAKKMSIRLDHRSYSIWFDKNEVSILTINGRKKINFKVPKYFEQYLEWRRRSAELFIKNNSVFINIVFEKDIEDIKPNNIFIGVDRGIKNLAVSSNNIFYGGGHVKQVSLRYEKLRSELQKKGSKSSKRHLKRISSKENRFRRDVNHCVSKKIVNSVTSGSTIVLENLKNIRDNSKKFRKEQKKWVNKWAFYQLEEFIKYKAKTKKVFVDYVDARYTSQKCSKCGHTEKSNRKSQSIFKCKHCGFTLNADLNASRNISKNYQDAINHPDRASVNKPIVDLNRNIKDLQAPTL